MNTYVLIPGAGGTAWYWSRVVPLLERAGHAAIAVDLPGDDESAGLAEYTDLVIAAIDEHTDGRGGVAMVAQSSAVHGRDGVCGSAGRIVDVRERDDPGSARDTGRLVDRHRRSPGPESRLRARWVRRRVRYGYLLPARRTRQARGRR